MEDQQSLLGQSLDARLEVRGENLKSPRRVCATRENDLGKNENALPKAKGNFRNAPLNQKKQQQRKKHPDRGEKKKS